ncbi:hypothetical protein AB0J82_16630 [Asanoa sp. NPDC049518]|uniref:hypothetical protein n=1 Tax=unclassified Asanoa TaxID=2685164 RepID=UPI0034134FB6
MGLSAEERAELRSNMEHRSSAAIWWVLLAMLLGFAALVAIFAARDETSELSSPWNFVVPLIPFAVVLAIAAPLLIRLRRRGPGPLVEGADTPTRKAVIRAISAGSTTDARIDDLVVDLREHGTARRLGLTAAIQLVGAIVLGSGAVISDETTSRLFFAGAAVALLAAVGVLFRRRRQLLAYRAGGGYDGPPAAVKGD